MKLFTVLLSFFVSSSAFAALGNWDWLEADDVLSVTCHFPADVQFRGALAGRVELLSEDEANQTYTAEATIHQLYASEFKNGREREKFKFEAKDNWPFGSTKLALSSPATVKVVPNADGKTINWDFSFAAPFKSGDKEKKDVKSIVFNSKVEGGTIRIDKTDFNTNCSITIPACGEYGSSSAGNGYGSGSYKGCHQEGEHVAKRYRVFYAFKKDMQDNLLGELRVNSFDYSGERRLKIEARLRQKGSSAHGWDFATYRRFLDRLAEATALPEGDERIEKLANLKESLVRALAGE